MKSQLLKKLRNNMFPGKVSNWYILRIWEKIWLSLKMWFFHWLGVKLISVGGRPTVVGRFLYSRKFLMNVLNGQICEKCDPYQFCHLERLDGFYTAPISNDCFEWTDFGQLWPHWLCHLDRLDGFYTAPVSNDYFWVNIYWTIVTSSLFSLWKVGRFLYSPNL